MGYLRFLVRRPATVLLIAAAISLLAGIQLRHLGFANSAEMWLLDDDPAFEAYARYKKYFENDDGLVIAWLAEGGVFSDRNLDLVDSLTDDLTGLAEVSRVTSIANVEEISSHGDDLSIGPMMQPPLTAQAQSRILDKLTNDRMYSGSVVDPDGRFSVLFVRMLRQDVDNLFERIAIVDSIQDRLAARAPDIEFHLTGGYMFDVEVFDVITGDQAVLIPAMLSILVITLLMMFRGITGVVLPTLTVVASVIWTLTVMAATGYSLNMIAAMLPIVLLAVGVADSIHMIAEYQEELATGLSKEAAVTRAVRSVFRPCLFTSVTTACGFLGLLIVRIDPLQAFGMFAALGCLFAFVATFTVVPAGLVLLPEPRVKKSALAKAGGTNRFLAGSFELVSRHRLAITLGSLFLLLVGVAGVPRVTVTNNWYNYLPSHNPTIASTDFVESSVGGVHLLEVLLSPNTSEGESGEGVKDPAFLHEVERFQSFLEAEATVQQTLSPVDFIKSMNRTWNGGADGEWRLPDSREGIAQLLLLYELDAPDGELYDFVDYDFQHARMIIRSSMATPRGHRRVIDKARAYAASRLDHGTAEVTGIMALYADMEEYLLFGMIGGFAMAFTAVSLIMMVVLRSFRHGLLAMIPALLPITLILGMTGWAGVSVGAMTAMMGNVSLGIAVDNAIHMLSRYRRRRAGGSDAHEAVRYSVTVVGRPVAYTAVVLCLGFAVLGFSEMIPSRRFGLLTAAVLSTSLLASVLTLPATLLLLDAPFDRRRRLYAVPAATSKSRAA